MAIDKGNIKTSANYDVRAQKPMEARREKPRKVDLITKESWSYDGNTVYAHEGLQVWVPEEGKTYVLKDLSKMFEPDYSGWDEMLTASTGAGGGLELREIKISESADDNAYNLETLELMRENKVLPALRIDEETLAPMTYLGGGKFIFQMIEMGIETQLSLIMKEDGSITMSSDVLAPSVLLASSKVLEWLTKNKTLVQWGLFEPAFVFYQAQFCLIDYYKATTGDNTKAVVQFNYGSQRFERVYNATTGEEISTTEIPLGGTGGGSITLDYEMSDTSTNAVSNKVIKEYVDNAAPHQFGEDFSEDFN